VRNIVGATVGRSVGETVGRSVGCPGLVTVGELVGV
jgi:hypothetical protein